MSTLAVATIKSISSAAPVFQNTSGTEKGQLAKAWCHVTVSGGTPSFDDSFGFSSITDVPVSYTHLTLPTIVSV